MLAVHSSQSRLHRRKHQLFFNSEWLYMFLSVQSLNVGVYVVFVHSLTFSTLEIWVFFIFSYFFSSTYSVFGSSSVSMVTCQTIGTSCLHPTQPPSKFGCRSEIKSWRESEQVLLKVFGVSWLFYGSALSLFFPLSLSTYKYTWISMVTRAAGLSAVCLGFVLVSSTWNCPISP